MYIRLSYHKYAYNVFYYLIHTFWSPKNYREDSTNIQKVSRIRSVTRLLDNPIILPYPYFSTQVGQKYGVQNLEEHWASAHNIQSIAYRNEMLKEWMYWWLVNEWLGRNEEYSFSIYKCIFTLKPEYLMDESWRNIDVSIHQSGTQGL